MFLRLYKVNTCDQGANQCRQYLAQFPVFGSSLPAPGFKWPGACAGASRSTKQPQQALHERLPLKTFHVRNRAPPSGRVVGEGGRGIENHARPASLRWPEPVRGVAGVTPCGLAQKAGAKDMKKLSLRESAEEAGGAVCWHTARSPRGFPPWRTPKHTKQKGFFLRSLSLFEMANYCGNLQTLCNLRSVSFDGFLAAICCKRCCASAGG